MASQEFCRVPKFIDYQYHEGQKLTSIVTVHNLLNKVVSYKVSVPSCRSSPTSRSSIW